jgi:hypothetical protein
VAPGDASQGRAGASEPPGGEWIPRDKGNAGSSAGVDERIRRPVAQIVVVLHEDDRRQALGARQLGRRYVGQPDMADLALGLQIDQCAERILERNAMVYRM